MIPMERPAKARINTARAGINNLSMIKPQKCSDRNL
jgi:hypothetical protein